MKKWFANLKQKRAQQAALRVQERAIRDKRKRERAEAERARIRAITQLKENMLDILAEGKVPEVNIDVQGTLPFRLLKTETLLWVFADVEYLENKIKRHIQGRSAGVSVRVMKGVSVRAGGSRGTPVETETTVSRGMGVLGITTKNVYFSGSKSVRIPFNKIVSLEPFRDAVGVTRDRASGLPEYFKCSDAQFLHQLLHSVPASEVTARSEQVEAAEYHLISNGGVIYED